MTGHPPIPISKKQKLSKTPLTKNNSEPNNNNNKEKQKSHSIRKHSKCHLGFDGKPSNVYNNKQTDQKSHANQRRNKKTSKNTKRVASCDSQQPEYLERSKIFYSKSYHERINSKHPLYGVDSSNAGAYKVLNSIYSFAPSPATTPGKPVGKIQRLPKHLVGVKNLFKTVIENFKKLKLITLLRFYCPCPRWLGGVRKGFGRKVNFWSKIHYRFLVKSFTPVEKVKYFIHENSNFFQSTLRYLENSTFRQIFFEVINCNSFFVRLT